MHISLDGFVSDSKGSLSWVKLDQEIFKFVSQRVGKTNTAMYGRKTFEIMENYWPKAGSRPNATNHEKVHSKWYNNTHKLVLSSTMKEASLPNTNIITDNISEQVKEIKSSINQNSNEILLFGSPQATQTLMELNLIDGFWLFLNPIVLGQGISLFNEFETMQLLSLNSIYQFQNGVISLDYTITKKEDFWAI